jgi:hypothetical protein
MPIPIHCRKDEESSDVGAVGEKQGQVLMSPEGERRESSLQLLSALYQRAPGPDDAQMKKEEKGR